MRFFTHFPGAWFCQAAEPTCSTNPCFFASAGPGIRLNPGCPVTTRGVSYKPSFATGILRGGYTPKWNSWNIISQGISWMFIHSILGYLQNPFKEIWSRRNFSKHISKHIRLHHPNLRMLIKAKINHTYLYGILRYPRLDIQVGMGPQPYDRVSFQIHDTQNLDR